jgi:hypothetical protein
LALILNPDLAVGATTFRHFVADDQFLLPMHRDHVIHARLTRKAAQSPKLVANRESAEADGGRFLLSKRDGRKLVGGD